MSAIRTCRVLRPDPQSLDRREDHHRANFSACHLSDTTVLVTVTGEVDAYIHAGGQYEWDSAAPVAVATATGLHASRIDGSALKYNGADPRLPDLLVCRKDLASRLLAALQRHSG